MNRLSFLRALGATLAAVPLGLLAAKKKEPESFTTGILRQMAEAPERTTPADEFESMVLRQRHVNAVMSDLQHKLDCQKPTAVQLTEDGMLSYGNFQPVYDSDKLVGAEFKPIIRVGGRLIYDADGYPRIVKA